MISGGIKHHDLSPDDPDVVSTLTEREGTVTIADFGDEKDWNSNQRLNKKEQIDMVLSTQPGAISIRPGGDTFPAGIEMGAFLSHQNDTTESGIVARLAQDEDDVEALLMDRLGNEITQRMEAHVLHSMELPTVKLSQVGGVDVVRAEDKEESSPTSGKNKKCIIVVTLILILVGGGGGLFYWLTSRNGKEDSNSKPLSQGVSESTLTPSHSPVHLDPLVEELRPFIAESEEDLLVFRDRTSPQSQALGWLQDDPITLSPDRLTETVLERYILAVLYYATSGPSWTVSYMLQDTDVCEWNDGGNETTFPFLNMGVYCSNETDRVRQVSLPDANLEGTLPWKELSLLSDLYLLDVGYSGLTGSLLPLQTLTSLGWFWAYDSRFSGALPDNLPPRLEQIIVRRN